MRWLAALALLALAAGCAPTVTGAQFRAFEQAARAEGLLRTDRAPRDAPFTNRDLLRNFDLVAFGLEPGINEGRSRVAYLRRWEEPIRWWIYADGPEAAGARTDVVETFARVRAATDHDIAEADSPRTANFDIRFLGEGDYDAAIAWARTEIDEEEARLIAEFRTNTFPCVARAFSRQDAQGDLPPSSYFYTLVLIREGFSPDFRLSCVEEEIVQSMGLGNDDDSVRPSIFNDDEEFALMTTHDEWLLRMLYDPRLRAGMGHPEAMLEAREVLRELRPGQ